MDQIDLSVCQENEINPQPVWGKNLKPAWPKYKSEVNFVSMGDRIIVKSALPRV